MPKRYSPNRRRQYILNKCYKSPSSPLCRRHVRSASDDMMTKGGHVPKAGTLRKQGLIRNKRGRYVSLRKSRNAARQYARPDSKLKLFNDFARRHMDEMGASGSEDEYDEDDDGDDLVGGDPSPPPSVRKSTRSTKGRSRKRLIEEFRGHRR